MLLTISKLVSWAMGSGPLSVMLGIGTLIYGGEHLIEVHREELRKQGADKCIAEWQLTTLKIERDVAMANAAAADEQRKASDYTATELDNARRQIAAELDTVRGSLVEQQRSCLSPRVRDLARGGAGTDGSAGGANPGGEHAGGRAKAP